MNEIRGIAPGIWEIITGKYAHLPADRLELVHAFCERFDFSGCPAMEEFKIADNLISLCEKHPFVEVKIKSFNGFRPKEAAPIKVEMDLNTATGTNVRELRLNIANSSDMKGFINAATEFQGVEYGDNIYGRFLLDADARAVDTLFEADTAVIDGNTAAMNAFADEAAHALSNRWEQLAAENSDFFAYAKQYIKKNQKGYYAFLKEQKIAPSEAKLPQNELLYLKRQAPEIVRNFLLESTSEQQQAFCKALGISSEPLKDLDARWKSFSATNFNPFFEYAEKYRQANPGAYYAFLNNGNLMDSERNRLLYRETFGHNLVRKFLLEGDETKRRELCEKLGIRFETLMEQTGTSAWDTAQEQLHRNLATVEAENLFDEPKVVEKINKELRGQAGVETDIRSARGHVDNSFRLNPTNTLETTQERAFKTAFRNGKTFYYKNKETGQRHMVTQVTEDVTDSASNVLYRAGDYIDIADDGVARVPRTLTRSEMEGFERCDAKGNLIKTGKKSKPFQDSRLTQFLTSERTLHEHETVFQAFRDEAERAELIDRKFRIIRDKKGSKFAEAMRAYDRSLFALPDIEKIVQYAGDDFEAIKPFIFQFKPKVEIVDTGMDFRDLLAQAGYTEIYDVRDDAGLKNIIDNFYAPGEAICTLGDDTRQNRCHIIHAIHKDARKLKREDFKHPRRQDAYGTSVISIQIDRKPPHKISIKNRYNHTVKLCDDTFDSNPDSIIPGLTKALEDEFQVDLSKAIELPKTHIVQDGQILDLFHLPKDVVIKGNLDLSRCDEWAEFPDLSHVTVEGDFNCSYSNLTNFERTPRHVGGNFHAYGRSFTSLKGMPEYIGGNFLINTENIRETTDIRTVIGGKFESNYNFFQDGKVYSLFDLPDGFVIKGDLDLSSSGLHELPDLSHVTVEGNFDCSLNSLKSLKGCPQTIGGNLNCMHNKLISLEGAPAKVNGNFTCTYNNLDSLNHAPVVVNGNFDCSKNKITSLKDSTLKWVGGRFDYQSIDVGNSFSLLGPGTPRYIGDVSAWGWSGLLYRAKYALKRTLKSIGITRKPSLPADVMPTERIPTDGKTRVSSETQPVKNREQASVSGSQEAARGKADGADLKTTLSNVAEADAPSLGRRALRMSKRAGGALIKGAAATMNVAGPGLGVLDVFDLADKYNSDASVGYKALQTVKTALYFHPEAWPAALYADVVESAWNDTQFRFDTAEGRTKAAELLGAQGVPAGLAERYVVDITNKMNDSLHVAGSRVGSNWAHAKASFGWTPEFNRYMDNLKADPQKYFEEGVRESNFFVVAEALKTGKVQVPADTMRHVLDRGDSDIAFLLANGTGAPYTTDDIARSFQLQRPIDTRQDVAVTLLENYGDQLTGPALDKIARAALQSRQAGTGVCQLTAPRLNAILAHYPKGAHMSPAVVRDILTLARTDPNAGELAEVLSVHGIDKGISLPVQTFDTAESRRAPLQHGHYFDFPQDRIIAEDMRPAEAAQYHHDVLEERVYLDDGRHLRLIYDTEEAYKAHAPSGVQVGDPHNPTVYDKNIQNQYALKDLTSYREKKAADGLVAWDAESGWTMTYAGQEALFNDPMFAPKIMAEGSARHITVRNGESVSTAGAKQEDVKQTPAENGGYTVEYPVEQHTTKQGDFTVYEAYRYDENHQLVRDEAVYSDGETHNRVQRVTYNAAGQRGISVKDPTPNQTAWARAEQLKRMAADPENAFYGALRAGDMEAQKYLLSLDPTLVQRPITYKQNGKTVTATVPDIIADLERKSGNTLAQNGQCITETLPEYTAKTSGMEL